VLEFMLVATAFGRTIYAAGINGRAAYLAGVSARRLRLQVYVLSGSVAGFAGVLLASHLNSVQPGLGSGYELTAIAACVLGGVSLAGGRGSVWRAVLGALFLVTLSQGLQLLGVDPLWFAIVTGASIVAAVAFDRVIQRLAGSLLQPRRPPTRPPADGESEATRAEAPSVPTQA
jgi:ribose/xylose/arabinose/galactoside ABC-type transport system permease subunit